MLQNLRRRAVVGLALIGSVAAGYRLFHYWRSASLESLVRNCRTLSTHLEWKELATASAKWADREPARADPWLYRAEAAEGLGEWENVVRFLDRVPRDDDRIIPALARKAIAEFENLNRPREGMKTCDEMLKIDPRVLIAHKQTIFFCAMTLQRAEMVRRIRRAIEVRRESPESYVYLAGTSWLYSGSIYRHNTHWLDSDPDDETFEVARSLQVYVSEAKLDLAHAAEFEHIPPDEDLLRKYPHNLELVAYFLNRCMTEGDLERVRELVHAVPAELADADPRFWRARAWCEDADGEFDAAERSLRRAFALDPYWWQVHFQLHDLLRRLGRHEESARYFQMYKTAKALRNEIQTLSQSVDDLDDRKFCRSLLELARMIEDNQVVAALEERLTKN